MTIDELRRLIESAVTVDVETAGRAYGIGRAPASALARAGQFPVPVLTVGARRRVRTADLAADLLPHTNEPAPATTETGSTTSRPGQEEEDRDHKRTPVRAA